ncbi:MAG: MFS transporter [Saprospiraceae bacterium]
MLNNRVIFTTVLVAALGYMVDIYDLIIFSIVRVQSLKDLGITDPAQIQSIGLGIIAAQMRGMLIGGILWGILGDKMGRLSVLFGSIILYSIANTANGFVQTVEQYHWLRFIAGIGLAGELGVGITLVSEVMSKEKRGFGTTIVASVGVAGAVLAYFVAEAFAWRNAYIFGGALGFALLLLRISVFESGMYQNIKKQKVQKGNFLKIFTNYRLFIKYIKCVLIGSSTWLIIGILVTSAPEFGKAFGMNNPPTTGAKAIMFCYLGLIIGDLSSGLLSQYLKSRRKTLFIYLSLTALASAFYLSSGNISLDYFYFKIFLIGVAGGFWVIFVSMASEQFGTNLRATVSTTVPNFARGSLDLLVWAFLFLSRDYGMNLGAVNAAWILSGICMAVSLIAVYYSEETFGKDLDYVEFM